MIRSVVPALFLFTKEIQSGYKKSLNEYLRNTDVNSHCFQWYSFTNSIIKDTKKQDYTN